MLAVDVGATAMKMGIFSDDNGVIPQLQKFSQNYEVKLPALPPGASLSTARESPPPRRGRIKVGVQRPHPTPFRQGRGILRTPFLPVLPHGASWRRRVKVVLDTNVYISGVFFTGPPERLRYVF